MAARKKTAVQSAHPKTARPKKPAVPKNTSNSAEKSVEFNKTNESFSAIIQVDEATKGLMEDIQHGITSEISMPVIKVSEKLNELYDMLESAERASKSASADAAGALKAAASAAEQAESVEGITARMAAEIKKLSFEQKLIKEQLEKNSEKLDLILSLLKQH